MKLKALDFLIRNDNKKGIDLYSKAIENANKNQANHVIQIIIIKVRFKTLIKFD
jgi:hypothetical protein